MKKLMQIGAPAFMSLAFTGCVAINVTQTSAEDMKQVSEKETIVRSEVSGIEPSVVRTDDIVSISVNLIGDFDVEKRTVYVGSSEVDEFMACGFFPGVMSCKGEYHDCFQNAVGAFFYNIVFAGLPTVHGLIIEPFIPYSPSQTDSIVDKSAFLKSTLIGFSRYSKPAKRRESEKVEVLKKGKIPLEDAVISAPSLELESYRGVPLEVPVDKLSANGDVNVTLRLPAEHPLKTAMSDFNDVEITIKCIDKQEK